MTLCGATFSTILYMPDRSPSKKAKARKPPKLGTSPTREVSRASTNDARPLFGLHNLVGDYNIAEYGQEERAAFAKLLHDMSERTWMQLILGPRQGTGLEKISQKSINVGIPGYITPDVQLWSIRINDMARLIGFRDGEVFHAVWIDPRHEVYDG